MAFEFDRARDKLLRLRIGWVSTNPNQAGDGKLSRRGSTSVKTEWSLASKELQREMRLVHMHRRRTMLNVFDGGETTSHSTASSKLRATVSRC